MYPFEAWHEFVLKKKIMKKKWGRKELEITSTPLRHVLLGVTLWGNTATGKSLLSMLAIQKGSLCQLCGVEFDFGRLSFRVMIHLHTGTRMDSLFSYVVGWKADVWMPFFGMMGPEMHIMLVYRLILESLGGFWLIWTCTVHPVVYILFCHFHFFAFCFSFLWFSFWDFVGISSANPHETLLVHLGWPRGLKGLLHTLNATVIPTKVS